VRDSRRSRRFPGILIMKGLSESGCSLDKNVGAGLSLWQAGPLFQVRASAYCLP